MFKSARLKLTFVYCLIFFSVFWLFSAGLYVWMDRSFGEGYISKVKNQQVEQTGDVAFDDKTVETVTVAGDVALGQLKRVLIILNGTMLLVVPGLAWVLTGRTLRPIEETYDKQKQFVSDASHELRTPLTIMQGELDVALKQPRTPKEYQATIKSTREELDRLHQLTEGLLLVARGDQERSISMNHSVDIVDVLTEVVSRFSRPAEAKHILLTFNPPNQRLTTEGFPVTIDQLFTNLVDNAIKFTPEHGRVSVSAKLAGKNIMISVEDSGMGMTKAQTSKVFGRFYRAETSRTTKGFGLGLAISKAITDQHHGTISLKSEPRKGTTVTVTLPKG